jgi:glycosyltransferase involved in cell wall biosynthesis
MTKASGAGAALYYAARNVDEARIAGIDVAVDRMTDAFLRHARQEILYCHAQDEAAYREFVEKAESFGRSAAACRHIPLNAAEGLAGPGCLLHPDPNIAPYAWPRRWHGQREYSLCGVSHTMSSANVMDAVGQCVIAPTQEWDAIICPSRAIAGSIRALWDEWRAYLADRTGARPSCDMQLPVIPLGIDTERFAPNRLPEKRADLRRRLGIGDDAFVVLFHGRISFYSKAHPLPILLAAEQVANRIERPVVLLFYGYFPTERFEDEFQALVHDIAYESTVRVVSNGDPDYPDGIWAAADVFSSLADNIQESFGLTPVEAMACGLPVLVSDWDGYRDTVTHGGEGLVVPTTMPPAGSGLDLGYRYLIGEETYGNYLAASSQTTAVDIDATAQALERLATNDDLRARLGGAGAARADNVYDWRHVIPAYESLWEELAARRAKAIESAARPPTRPAHPSRPDPYKMFAGFPTGHLNLADRLEIAVSSLDAINALLQHRMNMFTPHLLMDGSQIAVMIQTVKREPGITAAELVTQLAPDDRPRVLRTIAWLMKLGYLRRLGAETGMAPVG